MVRLAVLVVAICLLGACAEPLPPLEGIDLPPASLPDEFESGFWSVSFSHDYDPAGWAEGSHRYSLSLDCDIVLDEPLATGDVLFAVTAQARAHERVFLRLTGMSSSLVGPTSILAIEGKQPVTAVITILGVAEHDATEASDRCAGEVVIDGNSTDVLVGGEPFRP
jgi:hypothetical protein